MSEKKHTDEHVADVLATSRSLNAAAKALGMKPDRLRQRIASSLEIRKLLRGGRLAELEAASGAIFEGVEEAVATLRELVQASGPQDSVRQASACRILDYALKLRELDEAAEAAERAKESGTDEIKVPRFPVLTVHAGGSKAGD